MTRRRRLIIRTAPAGIEAEWEFEGDDLVVYLDAGLDEVTRQRYIDEAKIVNGMEPRRRRSGFLPIPLAAGVDTVRTHRGVSAAAALTVLTASGIALAVVHDTYQPHERPPGAAPAPRQPAPQPSKRPQKPAPSPTSPSRTRPSQPPPKPSPTAAATSLEPAVTTITSHLQPRLPLPTSLPVDLPPPIGGSPTKRPSTLPTPTKTPARVCVLRIHVDGARTVAVKLKVCLRA
jgi:hypothetical protein